MLEAIHNWCKLQFNLSLFRVIVKKYQPPTMTYMRKLCSWFVQEKDTHSLLTKTIVIK